MGLGHLKHGLDFDPNAFSADESADAVVLKIWMLSVDLQPIARDLRLLAQLDHTQAAAVSVLQLLRCASTGDGGHLAIVHADDWPEVRLITANSTLSANSLTAPLSTLPPAFCAASAANPSPLSRFLDFRGASPFKFLGQRSGITPLLHLPFQ